MSGRLEQRANWPELAVKAQWNVASLAELCGVSIATLERHFLKTFGTRPHGWMTGLRMGQALARLRNGATVKQAATEAGYRHAQHFSRDFRKHEGRPPSRFRPPTQV